MPNQGASQGPSSQLPCWWTAPNLLEARADWPLPMHTSVPMASSPTALPAHSHGQILPTMLVHMCAGITPCHCDCCPPPLLMCGHSAMSPLPGGTRTQTLITLPLPHHCNHQCKRMHGHWQLCPHHATAVAGMDAHMDTSNPAPTSSSSLPCHCQCESMCRNAATLRSPAPLPSGCACTPLCCCSCWLHE